MQQSVDTIDMQRTATQRTATAGMHGGGQDVQRADAIDMAYTHAPTQCIHTCTDTLDAPISCCEN